VPGSGIDLATLGGRHDGWRDRVVGAKDAIRELGPIPRAKLLLLRPAVAARTRTIRS